MENVTDKDAKPLLIYDGDCGFCWYWASYWQKLTGDAVNYRPYQEVGTQFPSISTKEFQQAVQYVAPDGSIASAAEASFLTLNNAPGQGLGLWLYRKVPGFAPVSEWAYHFISKRRGLFHNISIALWGRTLEPPKFDMLSWIFLRLLALIFLAAFLSFGSQAMALIGSQGIIPIADLVKHVNPNVGAIRFWVVPMVFWFNSSDVFIQATCWGGALFSLLLLFNILPRISLFILYLLYLSLFYAGQVFMSFQWDMFLLETGIVAFFLVGRTRYTGIMLMRWLLFRFVFAAGLVKLYSFDPTWRDMSALTYYFFTQPLPTPLAWYAQQLPISVLKVLTFSALFVELIIPFLIFFPRRLRFFAGYAILLMQTLISITGNYNFFNILTILLCLTLFDDQALRSLLPQRFINWLQPRVQSKAPGKMVNGIANVIAIYLIFISVVQFYERFSGKVPVPVLVAANVLEPFHLVNVYGPFAIITTQRMEIIIEGSADGVYWAEYGFKYKPGDVDRRPPWNIPHQPRVDWQLWFAALSSPNQNPWFFSFMRRLLENSPPVVNLLEYNPFPDKPPLFIRAEFYRYRFTTPEERKKTGAWWQREFVQDYFPTIHLVQ
ncbi:MAG: lipase maturation factor family protein [Pseudomonadota bacterium]